MKAIYTTSGMQITPYVESKMRPVFLARSLFNPAAHVRTPVTAHVVKDMSGKRLCTYNCGVSFLKELNPKIEICNMPKNQVFPLDHEFVLNPDIIPTELQASTIEAVLKNNFRNAFFNIPTGEGKTLLCVYLISLLKVKAWAMCYSVEVLNQWAKTLATMTDLDMSRILIVNDSKKYLEKMAAGDWDPHKYDMYLSTPGILTKWAERRGLDLLNDAFDTCGIGVKFYDEAHRNVGNICKINALTNVDRTYYLSADFSQAKPEQAALYYKMFNKVPVIRPDDEFISDKKYTQGVVVHYNTHPNFSQIESVFTNYGFRPYYYMDHQLKSDNFYEAIYRVLIAIHNWDPYGEHGYRTLLMGNMIEHTDFLYEKVCGMVSSIWGEYDPPVIGKYHSKLPEDEKRETLDKADIIVTTHQSMGVGIDLPLVRYVCMLAPVNPIQDNQAAGRARRLKDGKDCFYFMFIDDGFAYMTKHLDDRVDYLYRQKIKQFSSITYS